MANRPINPEDRKVLFNARIPQATKQKIATYCYRKSVHALKKYSEATFIEDLVDEARLPRPPTPKEEAAYEATRHFDQKK